MSSFDGVPASDDAMSMRSKPDLLIVTDSTASMGDFLQAICESLPAISDVASLTECFHRIGVVAYHDYCDPVVTVWSGWHHFADSWEMKELGGWVSKLRATGGGDTPEAAKTALATAIGLADGAPVITVWFTDAGAHHPVTTGTNWRSEQKRLAADAAAWPAMAASAAPAAPSTVWTAAGSALAGAAVRAEEAVSAVVGLVRGESILEDEVSGASPAAPAPELEAAATPAAKELVAEQRRAAAQARAAAELVRARAKGAHLAVAAAAAFAGKGSPPPAASSPAKPATASFPTAASPATAGAVAKTSPAAAGATGASPAAKTSPAAAAKTSPAAGAKGGSAAPSKKASPAAAGAGAGAAASTAADAAASDWVTLSAAAATAGLTVYPVIDREEWSCSSFAMWLAARTGGACLATHNRSANNLSAIVINLLLALMGSPYAFPPGTVRLTYGTGNDKPYHDNNRGTGPSKPAAPAAAGAGKGAAAGGKGAAAAAGAGKGGAAAGKGAAGPAAAGKVSPAPPASPALRPSAAPGSDATPVADTRPCSGSASTALRHALAHASDEAAAAGFLMDTRRKAGTEITRVAGHGTSETASHRHSTGLLKGAVAGEAATVLADCVPHAAALTDLRPLLQRFNREEGYRERVYAVFGRLLGPRTVLSLTHNAVFGSFWRAICKRRGDERRAGFLAQIARSLTALEGTDPAAAAAVRGWLDASYDAEEEIKETLAELPHAGLAGPVLVLDAKTTWKAQELLEVVRSCSPAVLARVSGLMAGLWCAQPAPAAGAAPSGADGAIGEPALAPVPAGEAYLPLALPDADLFGFLPHLMCRGTTVTTRGAAIFAAVAILSRNAFLKDRATAFLASVRGRWLDWETTSENYALSFLRLMLRVAPLALTPAEAARVHFLTRLGGLAVNGDTVLPLRLPIAPDRCSLRPDFKVTCPSCKHKRSFTLIAADGRCALCHCSGGVEKAARVPEPADTKPGQPIVAAPATDGKSAATGAADGAAGAGAAPGTGAGAAPGAHAAAAASALSDVEFGLSHWCECRTCHAHYTVVRPELLKVDPKCHYCRQASGEGVAAASAKAAAEAKIAGAKKAKKGESVGAVVGDPPCVSCSCCGNKFVAAHLASLLAAAPYGAKALAAGAPSETEAAEVAAAAAAVASAGTPRLSGRFVCPSCAAAACGAFSKRSLLAEEEVALAALAREREANRGAMLRAVGLQDKVPDPEAIAAADAAAGATGGKPAAAAPAPGSKPAAAAAAGPYDLWAGSASTMRSQPFFEPRAGFRLVFPRPDGLPMATASDVSEISGGAAEMPSLADDAAAAARVGTTGAAATASAGAGGGSAGGSSGEEGMLLWYRSKPVLNSASVLRQVASWAASASVQTGCCSLCFDDKRRSTLRSACGRTGCSSVACDGCLRTFYGAAKPGHLLLPSTLCCPFCKRAPAAQVLTALNPELRGLVREPGDLLPGWYYGWCITCSRPRRAIEKTCAREPPDFTRFECDACTRMRILRAQAVRAAGEAAADAEAAARAAHAYSLAVGVLSRPCPGCGVEVEREDGCGHITCLCDEHFCFKCGKGFGRSDMAGMDCYDHLYAAHGGAFVEITAEDFANVRRLVRDPAAAAAAAAAAKAALVAVGAAAEELAAAEWGTDIDVDEWLELAVQEAMAAAGGRRAGDRGAAARGAGAGGHGAGRR